MSSETPGSPIRVLLVDDDADEHVIVGDLLQAAHWQNFALTSKTTYEEGLRAILSSSFDVCLVDYRLGERTGLDLLAEVTAQSSHAQIILLSGDSDRAIDVTAAAAGAADYLLKADLTCALLERAIRYAVERGRTSKALRDATEAAQSCNRAKSEFLANMSHDIRTPMNAILGMLDLLAESQLDDSQSKYVDVSRRAGANLLALINDILDFSKIEADQLNLNHVDFDLEEIVNYVVELTGVKAREKGIVLLSHLAPGLSTSLVGDPTRLIQVLINLVGNAVKFTDSGEVRITVEDCEAGSLGEIEFAVSDTGIGILPDKLETIFNSFTQADPSTTRKYGGTGLGLTISRRIVEQMNGHLTVTSRFGKGSTFRFNAQFGLGTRNNRRASRRVNDPQGGRGPVLNKTGGNPQDDQPLRLQGGAQPERIARPLRILIAEDSPDNSLLIQAYMKGSAHQLTFVENGNAAIEAFATSGFDLILMDVHMPFMDGLTATRAIRTIEQERGSVSIPVIALTANAGSKNAQLSREAGCNYHLSKPISKHELLSAIKEYAHQPKYVDRQPTDCVLPHVRSLDLLRDPGNISALSNYLDLSTPLTDAKPSAP